MYTTRQAVAVTAVIDMSYPDVSRSTELLVPDSISMWVAANILKEQSHESDFSDVIHEALNYIDANSGDLFVDMCQISVTENFESLDDTINYFTGVIQNHVADALERYDNKEL